MTLEREEGYEWHRPQDDTARPGFRPATGRKRHEKTPLTPLTPCEARSVAVHSPPDGGEISISQSMRVSVASDAITEQYLSYESCTARSTCSRGESVETR